MKEYELLSEYTHESVEGNFDTLFTVTSHKTYELLDLEFCRKRVNELFDFMIAKKRFDKLHEESKRKLKYGMNGFDLEGHMFETLDEVEHALRNKAFL